MEVLPENPGERVVLRESYSLGMFPDIRATTP